MTSTEQFWEDLIFEIENDLDTDAEAHLLLSDGISESVARDSSQLCERDIQSILDYVRVRSEEDHLFGLRNRNACCGIQSELHFADQTDGKTGIRQELRASRTLVDDIPKEHDEIIRQRVAKNPDGRIQSAAELIEEIEMPRASLRRHSVALQARVIAISVFAFIVTAVLFAAYSWPPRRESPVLFPASVHIVRPVQLATEPKNNSKRRSSLVKAGETASSPGVLPTFKNSLEMVFVKVPIDQHADMGGFWICAYETTEANYVLRTNPRPPPDGAELPDLLPVVNVTFQNARNFCEILSNLPSEKKAGNTYRLPTLAEWQYAAVAGANTVYSWGDDPSRIGEYAWWIGNSGNRRHPVGLKLPNRWGLYDMDGNVSVWTMQNARFEDRMIAGSFWGSRHNFNQRDERPTARSPSRRDNSIGIRLICEIRD